MKADISIAVVALMASKGKSQYVIAAKFNVTQATISNFMKANMISPAKKQGGSTRNWKPRSQWKPDITIREENGITIKVYAPLYATGLSPHYTAR